MRVIYEFHIDNEDDLIRYRRCVEVDELCSALHEFAYNSKKGMLVEAGMCADAYDAVDMVYERFWDILNQHNVNIDKLF
jgi:hypothetical protein